MPDYDVDLEKTDHAASPLGGSEFSNVDRAQDGGTADAEAANEAGHHQDGPVPGKGAADRGDGVQDGHNAQGFAAADLLAQLAGDHRTDDCADQAYENGEAQGFRSEVKDFAELLRGARDDGGVEAEEETAQRSNGSRFCEVSVQRRSPRNGTIFLVQLRVRGLSKKRIGRSDILPMHRRRHTVRRKTAQRAARSEAG